MMQGSKAHFAELALANVGLGPAKYEQAAPREGPTKWGAACQWHAFSADRSGAERFPGGQAASVFRGMQSIPSEEATNVADCEYLRAREHVSVERPAS